MTGSVWDPLCINGLCRLFTEPYRLVFPSCLHYLISFTLVLRNIGGKKEMRMDLSRPTQIKRRWCSIEMTPTMLVWRPWKQVVLGRKIFPSAKAGLNVSLLLQQKSLLDRVSPTGDFPVRAGKVMKASQGLSQTAQQARKITQLDIRTECILILSFVIFENKWNHHPFHWKECYLWNGSPFLVEPQHEVSGYCLWLTCFSFVVWIFVKKQPYFKRTFP